ncbi:glycosyltransferase family 2 protein [Buttiauxella ferragutiae]|uniref:glycosyltransferase family 2 protein n=1 Tax=Buttiauxella ferragutiae TaxID=82989 RepID=UPI0035237086
MNKYPLLTIAVPTYNRSACLVRLLNSIISQGKDCLVDVEIIVCDNASFDKTGEVSDNLLRRIPNTYYYLNDQNIGMDGNFSKCYELARGEYFWMIGDDDYIQEGGLSKVLNILKSHPHLDLLYVNSVLIEGKSNTPVEPSFFTNSEDFISQVKVMFTFISGIISKRNDKTLNEVKALTPAFSEMYLMHLSWQFTLLKNGSEFCILHDGIIKAEEDNSGGYHLYKVFSNNLATIIDNFYAREHVISRTIRFSASLFLLNFLGNEDKTKRFSTENYLLECDKAFLDLKSYKYMLRFFYLFPKVTPVLRALKYFIKWVMRKKC